jgi:hypothetical protein
MSVFLLGQTACAQSGPAQETLRKAEDCFEREEYVCAVYNFDKLVRADEFESVGQATDIYFRLSKALYLLTTSEKFDISREEKLDSLANARLLLSSIGMERTVLYLAVNARFLRLSPDVCSEQFAEVLEEQGRVLAGSADMPDLGDYPPNILELLSKDFESLKSKSDACGASK